MEHSTCCLSEYSAHAARPRSTSSSVVVVVVVVVVAPSTHHDVRGLPPTTMSFAALSFTHAVAAPAKMSGLRRGTRCDAMRHVRLER
jgi:ABC-type uncharacterized transport system permease subunit